MIFYLHEKKRKTFKYSIVNNYCNYYTRKQEPLLVRIFVAYLHYLFVLRMYIFIKKKIFFQTVAILSLQLLRFSKLCEIEIDHVMIDESEFVHEFVHEFAIFV